MIFATDLDKTLIYHKKYVNEDIMDKVQLIETIGENPVCYMSIEAKNKLQEISKKINVIPTTTRSIDEFFNVKTFEYCKYAIVSNGGKILEDKKIMPEWEKHINNIIANYKDDFNGIINLLEKSGLTTTNPQVIDNIYVFSRVEDKEKCLNFLNGKINQDKWNYCVQGKKLYVIPKEIKKSNAVKFLKNKLNSNYLIVAGDSLMDKDMLDIADLPIVPKHGELYKKYNYQRENIFFTKEGIFAADDIVQKVNNTI